MLPQRCEAVYGLIVTTDKVQYKTGDDVIVKVRNELAEPIYFLGMCSLKDCFKNEDQWSCEDAKCDAPQDILVTGEEKEFRVRVIGLLVGDMKYKFDYRTAILEKDLSTYSNEFFIINTGKPTGYVLKSQEKDTSLRIQDKDASSDEKEIQSHIMDIKPSDQPIDKQYVAKKSKKQKTPNKKRSSRSSKKQESISAPNGGYNLKDNEVVLQISGINKKEKKDITRLLQDEFSFIQSVEEIGFEQGDVQYFIALEISAVEFADRLEKAQFRTFTLKVIRYNLNYIDCVLNYK
ncbi:MAG: hypothetical protein AB7S78_07350 [Candidatus Omnitrophota bacterium]